MQGNNKKYPKYSIGEFAGKVKGLSVWLEVETTHTNGKIEGHIYLRTASDVPIEQRCICRPIPFTLGDKDGNESIWQLVIELKNKYNLDIPEGYGRINSNIESKVSSKQPHNK